MASMAAIKGNDSNLIVPTEAEGILTERWGKSKRASEGIQTKESKSCARARERERLNSYCKGKLNNSLCE